MSNILLLFLGACFKCEAAAAAAAACSSLITKHGHLPFLQISNCTDFYTIGFLQGRAFSAIIQHSIRISVALSRALAYANTEQGGLLLSEMTKLHTERFPEFMRELDGIAAGAQVPFSKIFLLNLRAEFPQLNAPPQEEEEGCSDVLAVMACERELQRASKVDKHAQIVLAHNEDVGRDSIGGLYFVRVTQSTNIWLALCYAGELGSTAFGASKRSGIAYTLNAIYPSPQAKLLPGIGRNFVSRMLLEAPVPGFQAGLDLLRMPNQATGRSLNLLEMSPGRGLRPRLMNVEIAPGKVTHSSEQNIRRGTWLFHANAYQRLKGVPEEDAPSSYHREAAAAHFGQLPLSHGPLGALWVLGDTSDRRWPIYRSGTSTKDTGFTECTILITASLPGEQRSANDNNRGGSDLRIRATVLQGNPRKRQEVTSFDLSDDLQPTQNGCLFS